jgi:hypothetical protein
MTVFEELLFQLGEELGCPLHPEKGRICKININSNMHLNIELDEAKESILLGCMVSEVPPGRFREIVFKETLRINNTIEKIGTFAFSERNHNLVLFSYIPLTGLTIDTFIKKTMHFMEFADDWRLCIQSGNLSKMALAAPSTSGPPLGVKR